MAGEPGGIAASVRRKLEAGQSRDDIVAGLMAGGLSKPSAERFVDREIGAQLPPLEPLIPEPPPLPPPVEEIIQTEGTMYEGPPPDQAPDQIDQFFARTEDDIAQAEADAKRDLRLGSYVTTAGIALTLVSMLFPGRGVLFYGAVLYGVFRFIRGLVRYARLDVPFPWARAAALAAIPILSFPVIFIAVGVFAIQSDMSAAREVETGQSETAQTIRRQAGDAYERRQQRNDENVDALVEKLQSMGWTCDAAAELARTRSSRAVEPLIRYLQTNNRIANQTQVCIVKALVDLGEIAPAIGYYRHWINGTDRSMWRQGVMGLGEIGPDAAAEALPLLKYLVDSDNVGERVLAVQTLAKLGPDAAEMLRYLEEDPEYTVRYQAREALKNLQ